MRAMSHLTLFATLTLLLAITSIQGASQDQIFQFPTNTGECGLNCATFQSDISLYSCLANAFGSRFSQNVVWYFNGTAYDVARAQQYGRQAYPECVVYANSTDDVVAAVTCATLYGFQVSAAGRRHSYQGWGVMSGYVTIDMSNICPPPTIDTTTMTMVAGAGCTNAVLLAAVTNSGVPGLMSVIGSCPSVGIVGYALGGGMGDITPYVGLGCDQVVELEMVLYNGTVITANNSSHTDVFWASCGGGPGIGVITQLKLKVHVAPNPDHFTVLQFVYPPGESAITGTTRFQSFINNQSNTDVTRLYGGGCTLAAAYSSCTLVYLGPWQEAVLGLGDVLDPGLLSDAFNGLLQVNFKNQSATVNNITFPANGLRISEFPMYGYAEAYQICNFGVGQQWPCSLTVGENCTFAVNCNDQSILDMILKNAANPQSNLNLGPRILSQASVMLGEVPNQVSFAFPGGLMVTGVPQEGLAEMFAFWKNNFPPAECDINLGYNHLTHGKVREIPSDAAAYPWRNETIVLQYGVGAGPATSIIKCHNMSNELTNILLKYIGPYSNLKGYYNYMGGPQVNWQKFYFGDNYPRLQRIKAAYDPLNIFGKPVTMQAVSIEAASTVIANDSSTGSLGSASSGGISVFSVPGVQILKFFYCMYLLLFFFGSFLSNTF